MNQIKDNIKLIIPMSGIGKRFIDAGYTVPKPLINVDGLPIINHVLNLFPGITDITFICNEKHLVDDDMKNILLGISPNAKIFEVSDHDRKGPVDAISKIFDEIEDDKEIIISYCDYGTYWHFDEFLEEIRQNNVDGSIACYKGFHPHMLNENNYAFCREENKFLLEIKEKESFTNNKMGEYASNGTYYFKSGKLLKKYFKKLIDNNINVGGECYVSLVYNLLVNDGLKVNLFEIENMLQWGTPEDLESYNYWSEYFTNIISPQQKIINPKNTTTILPMAGRGSRFTENGFSTPKPMIDINGLPMVIQAVNCLPQSNVNVFICQQSHLRESDIGIKLDSTFKNSNIIGIDKVTEGQACTCEIGIEESKIDIENPILISACDNGVFYNKNYYQKLIDDKNIDIIVWTFRNGQTTKNNPNMYSWVDVDCNNMIKEVSCKKLKYGDPSKTHTIIGTMFFRKGNYFLDGLKENYDKNLRTNNEFYVDDVINRCIEKGLKVKAFEVINYICWGTPNDYNTYIYWRDFFHKCDWHQYTIEKDVTYHDIYHHNN